LRCARRLHKSPQSTFLQASVHFCRNIHAFNHVAIVWQGGFGARCRALVDGWGYGCIR
jgi:hypothetical protein